MIYIYVTYGMVHTYLDLWFRYRYTETYGFSRDFYRDRASALMDIGL